MVGWNTKRRILVCLISTVCFITIGLHSLTSFNTNRKQFSESDITDDFLHRVVRKQEGHLQGNVISARQLASYDSLQRGDPADNNANVKVETKLPMGELKSRANNTSRSKTAVPVMKEIVGTPIKRENKNEEKDDPDDEEKFTGCQGNGTVDMGGYPFIDARTVFCGEAFGPREQTDSSSVWFLRAPGAVSRSLVETVLIGRGMTLSEGGKLQELYVLGKPIIKLNEVSVQGEEHFVLAKQFSVLSNGRRRIKNNRELQLAGGDTHDVGPLLFFPPLLSDHDVLMTFLRTLYKVCTRQSKGDTRYAATVIRASVGGRTISSQFCVYLGLIGGGIKESYVIRTNGCKSEPLPKGVAHCLLTDVKL